MNEPSFLSALLGYIALAAVFGIYFLIRHLWFPFDDDK